MPDRREVLLAGAGLALAASGLAGAAEPAAAPKLAAALGKCVEAGNVCLEHCLTVLGKGDTTLAACAVAVRDMLAVCNALGVLAAGQSVYLKPAARLCIEVCEGCEKACRVHEQHHSECKVCAEACAAVIAAARLVVA